MITDDAIDSATIKSILRSEKSFDTPLIYWNLATFRKSK